MPDSFVIVRGRGREKILVDNKGLWLRCRYRYSHRKGRLCPGEDTLRLLDDHDLAAFKAEHWGNAAVRRKKAVIKFPLSANIKNKRVLVVDDITDTGETLRISLQYLIGFEPKEVKAAV